MSNKNNAPVFLNDLGIVCAIGGEKESVWQSITHGPTTGIRATTIGDREFALGMVPEEYYTERPPAPYDNRLHALELRALREIEAGILRAKERYGAGRIAVVMGSTDNESEFSLTNLDHRLRNGSYSEGYRLEYQRADFPAHFIAQTYGLTGPIMTISTACSSGAGAVISARELLRAGFCDAAVAGGADIVSRTVTYGFDALEILSDRPCLPFSRNRKGINLGEGAAFFLMSRERLTDHAGLLLGAGESSDAYHMTAPDPSGAGASKAMRRALIDAGIEPDQVDYINLHGTGTPMNDAMESKAVVEVYSTTVPASSTKCLTGHTLGAAGAVELGICWLALSSYNPRHLAPAQIWDGERDGNLPRIDIVDKPRRLDRLSICSSNSFAFGGSNVNLIIGRPEP